MKPTGTRAIRGMTAVFALLLLPAPLPAQEPVRPFRYDWSGTTAFVIGTCWHGYAVAGASAGAEAFVVRGLTVGADLGAHRFVAHDPIFGLLTAKVGYHFVDRGRPARVDPFINLLVGGAFTGDIAASSAGFGGGLNCWFSDRIGLHSEARFQVVSVMEGLLTFRIGLSFR